MKKLKYNCHNCKKENIVTSGDVFSMGMGHGGVSATEIGLEFGGAMFGMNGGFSGFPSGRPLPKQIAHKCTHCNVKNIITL